MYAIEVNTVQAVFAGNVKRRRESLAMTQRELAQKSGMSQGYLAEIETGKKFPSAESIERLCTALEVRPFELFVEAEDLSSLPPGAAMEEVFYQINESFHKAFDETREKYDSLKTIRHEAFPERSDQ